MKNNWQFHLSVALLCFGLMWEITFLIGLAAGMNLGLALMLAIAEYLGIEV